MRRHPPDNDHINRFGRFKLESTIAVLIDFENIAAGTEKDGLGRFDVELVLKRVKDKGRVIMSRSYADWGRFSRFKQTLLANNVTMMELTSHGMQDKNKTIREKKPNKKTKQMKTTNKKAKIVVLY